MKLVVGLGNPGIEYTNTRHNIGFMMLDEYLGNVKWSMKMGGAYYETNINGEKYLFLKPQLYMNLSGGVVKKYVDYFDIPLNNILVIQDDLDLPLAHLRLKKMSSAGGHNGIKDIIANLHSDNFLRLKIGISHDRNLDTRDYVLTKFTKSELDALKNISSTVGNIIENFAVANVTELMNKYN